MHSNWPGSLVAIVLATCAAFSAAAEGVPAPPQWTSPDSRVTVRSPDGWLEVSALSEERVPGEWRSTGLRPTLLTLRPANWRSLGSETPFCVVQRDVHTEGVGISQAVINNAGASMTQVRVAAQQNIVRVHAFSNAVRDGVRFVDVSGEVEPGPEQTAYIRHMTFILTSPEGALQFALVCGGASPLAAEHQTAISAFMESVAINNGDAQQ